VSRAAAEAQSINVPSVQCYGKSLLNINSCFILLNQTFKYTSKNCSILSQLSLGKVIFDQKSQYLTSLLADNVYVFFFAHAQASWEAAETQ